MAPTLKFVTLILLLLASALWCQTIDEDKDGGEDLVATDAPFSGETITVGGLFTDGFYNLLSQVFDNVMTIFKVSEKPVYNFTLAFPNLRIKIVILPEDPSPSDILNALCSKLLPENVTAIFHIPNTGKSKQFSSDEYFLQLTNYLGIPVLTSWNAVLDQKFSDSTLLQLSPTFSHQAAIMLSVLIRYKWKMFSVVTSRTLGHENFVQSIIHEVAQQSHRSFKLELVHTVTLNDVNDTETTISQLRPLAEGVARAFLLHCSDQDVVRIMDAADQLNLTGKYFIWIVTQSAILVDETAPLSLPVGMLGVDFETGLNAQFGMFLKAAQVLAHGLELFVNDPNNVNRSLSSNHKCLGPADEKWKDGILLRKYMLGVKFSGSSDDDYTVVDPINQVDFNADGTLKYTFLNLVNLNAEHKWIEVGKWRLGTLHIKDIVWPGRLAYPPFGEPENYNLVVGFLEEKPYVHMNQPDNKTGLCHEQAVRCRIPPVPVGTVDPTGVGTNETQFRCCSGFCVDLLRRLSQVMSFTFEMRRATDGLWGVIQQNRSWNGLMSDLIEHRVDMAMTSLKINSRRQAAVDFSVPFLETGISVVVAKRTGIISPKAFLEPFDMISWFFILVICIQAVTVSIFAFEWLSPSGFDRKLSPNVGHNFSLFRTYWLVWALLFGASVNVSVPRGYTARFMSNVWAGFTVVFLAIYTANLAAFMITREDFYDLDGLEDHRLQFPMSHQPNLRFGTIPHGNTDDIVRSKFPAMHHYMKNHSRNTVQEGIAAVKKGELDAFIYDSTVLEYLVGQDDECRLLTVGRWYAKTGYGVAFPRNSRLLATVNQILFYYSSTGILSRLSDFWMSGACKTRASQNSHLQGFSYVAISLKQFASAFLLLGVGLVLGFVILGLEKMYFTYLRAPLARRQTEENCCALISLNLGRSLTFEEAANEARDVFKHNRCKDPRCDTILLKGTSALELRQRNEQRLTGTSVRD